MVHMWHNRNTALLIVLCSTFIQLNYNWPAWQHRWCIVKHKSSGLARRPRQNVAYHNVTKSLSIHDSYAVLIITVSSKIVLKSLFSDALSSSNFTKFVFGCMALPRTPPTPLGSLQPYPGHVVGWGGAGHPPRPLRLLACQWGPALWSA